MKCALSGCANSAPNNAEKYFFSSPSPGERRELWIKSTGKTYGPKSKFQICEDHFDMRKDVDIYRTNGAPLLKKSVGPHRNLTQSDMALQAKLDKIIWSCFVPSCQNTKCMTDKKVVFFPVPDGLQGQLWKTAVMADESYLHAPSVDEIEFCCEEHFDITTDIEKNFHSDSSVEFTIKAGVLPTLNLNESKRIIWNEVQRSRLSDFYAHPRMIMNNDLAYLYASKLALVKEKLQMTDFVTLVDVRDIKTEPVELENGTNITVELMDAGYECESKSDFVIERELLYFDLDPDCKSDSEHDSESVSSVTNKESKNDPDITTDDFSTTDDEDDSISSGDLIDTTSSDSDDDSDLDTAERFECCHCKRFVKHLDSHVERAHWNFAKNVNRTVCGLCLETFPRRINVKNHQIQNHGGNAYACDVCDYMARRRNEIQKHIIRIHSQESEFLCQHCGVGYKFSRDLNRHMKSHLDVRERSQSCQHCDKKFFNVHSLNKHINSVHLKARPYQCKFDGCSKSFKQKTYLKTHQRVHMNENEKPLFSCIICEKKFTFKWNLTAHIKNIHNKT